MGYTFASKLKESGLTTKDAKVLGIEYIKAPRMLELAPHYRESDGLYIPYFDSHGKPLPDGFHRVRYFKDYSDEARGRKYDGPASSFPHAYFPTNQRWSKIAEDITANITITEGELKAAAACKKGIPTIGIGGVWSFRAKRHEIAFLPELEAFKWAGRKVELCFDSDIAAKPQVRLALIHLAKALTERGAVVVEVQLAGGQTSDTKVGLDDYLVAHGAEAYAALDRTQPDPITQRFAEYLANWVFVLKDGHIVDLGSPLTDGSMIIFENPTKFDAATKHIHHIYLDGDKAKKIYASKWWLEYPRRKNVHSYTLDPSSTDLITHKGLNLFRGFGTEPRSGKVEPMLKLIDVLTSNRRELRRWLIQWLAFPLQHPGTKLATCVFVASPHQGLGKSALGYVMLDIYSGPAPTIDDPHPDKSLGTGHGVELSDDEIFGPWNEWYEGALWAMGDDLAFAGDKKSKGTFKRMITSESIHLSAKYRSRRQIANKCNFYFTANSLGALPLEESDNRRVLVLNIPTMPKGWQEYMQNEWHTWRHTGGAAAWLAYLLQVDLTDFKPKANAPSTPEKSTAVLSSGTQVSLWLAEEYETLAAHSELWRTRVILERYRSATDDRQTSVTAMNRALAAHHALHFGRMRIAGKEISDLWALTNHGAWSRRKGKAVSEYYQARFDLFDQPKNMRNDA